MYALLLKAPGGLVLFNAWRRLYALAWELVMVTDSPWWTYGRVSKIGGLPGAGGYKWTQWTMVWGSGDKTIDA